MLFFWQLLHIAAINHRTILSVNQFVDCAHFLRGHRLISFMQKNLHQRRARKRTESIGERRPLVTAAMECPEKGGRGSTGTLFIVSTPIGNLEDISIRAIRVLKEVHLIAAEDTRRTRILLDKYQISTPMTSLYDRNESQKSSLLLARLQVGEDVASVSDAGTEATSSQIGRAHV